jgi:endo-1,3-1,4-beta-glycanase ExoK
MRTSLQLIGAGAASALLLAPYSAQAKPWKGAELITQQTFLYGAFEARIRAARGSGMITPFFLWKNNSEVPGQEWQEQDFEIFGRDGGYQTQLMTPGEDGEQRTEHRTYHPLPEPAWQRYYTYRMEWTPEYLAFYVDGELVRIETDAAEFDKLMSPERAEPAQLRVSLWAGDTGWSGFFDADSVPAGTFVNWVQTYAYTPGGGPGGADFTPLWRDDFDGSGPSAPDSSRWWAANWTFDYAVNDYVGQNARVADGTLVIAFTDEASVGTLPAVPPDVPSSGEEDAAGGDGDSGGGTGAAPSCEDGAALYAAEDMSPTVGAPSGEGWNLWSNGSISATVTLTEGARIDVRARGQLGGGAWPHLVVRLDGEVIGDALVDSAEYAAYEFRASGAGTRVLSVAFDNDYNQGDEDRNLYLDTVAIAPLCE